MIHRERVNKVLANALLWAERGNPAAAMALVLSRLAVQGSTEAGTALQVVRDLHGGSCRLQASEDSPTATAILLWSDTRIGGYAIVDVRIEHGDHPMHRLRLVWPGNGQPWWEVPDHTLDLIRVDERD